MPPLDAFLSRTRIAYLSMEIAFDPAIPTYAGGLGVLAGDTVRAAADLSLPMVFVTLASREGYLRQEVSGDGDQLDRLDPWDPADYLEALEAGVAIRIEERPVWIRAWLRLHQSPVGGCVPVIVLDTDLPPNDERDRRITDRLYGGDLTMRLKQEAVLGIGGERILRALGFEIATYHLNEGHAALLPVTMLRRHRLADDHPLDRKLRYDEEPVRAACVFTTHTPLEAGSDRFPYDLVARVLDDFFELEQLRLLGGADALNMTRLALNLSSRVNAVAIRHAETTQHMYPGYRVHAITNGVHPPTWAHPALAKLFDAAAPGWAHNPDLLIRLDRVSDEAIQAAHGEAKADLISEAQRRGVALNPALPIIGFARRMTGYKRPDLLFTDLARLRAIAARHPFQIVMAGKAHPADVHGKEIIRQINQYARELARDLTVAFMPGYNMKLAKTVVSGCDVWLNVPIPPLEASGTSGMKAALNGIPNFSVLDGWWVEGWEEGVTGWSIGDGLASSEHARDLYDKLESTILPMWHSDGQRWAAIMKSCIARIGSRFNSINMMRRYATEIYLR